jgi:hypothetical protein
MRFAAPLGTLKLPSSAAWTASRRCACRYLLRQKRDTFWQLQVCTEQSLPR